MNIVLTDGEDNSSKVDSTELIALMYKLNKDLGSMCKTFVIGVDLEKSAVADIAMLMAFGGDAFSFENVNDVDIDEVFDRIQASIGLHRRALLISDGETAVGIQQTGVSCSSAVR